MGGAANFNAENAIGAANPGAGAAGDAGFGHDGAPRARPALRTKPEFGPLDGWSALSMLALFRLSVRQVLRPRALAPQVLVFAVPTIIALVLRQFGDDYTRIEDLRRFRDFVLYGFMPGFLVPIAALTYASGIIRAEIENQTLTYLLLRPLSRPAIYLVKLVAGVAVSACLIVPCTFAAFLAVTMGYETELGVTGGQVAREALATSGLFMLSLLTYSALFGLLGLFAKRPAVAGIILIVVVEGGLSNFDWVLRWFTVLYHFRNLSFQWLGVNPETWDLNLETALTPQQSLSSLLGFSFAATLAATLIIRAREFRVKTPEGG